MRTRELIEILKRFDPESTVRVCTDANGQVVRSHSSLAVTNWGDGPQVHVTTDYRCFSVYVGCGIEQFVSPVPLEAFQLEVDLGEYDDPVDADHVHDFYVVSHRLDFPLRHPDFDYDDWIPPRTVSGSYNPHVADILKEKLSGD